MVNIFLIFFENGFKVIIDRIIKKNNCYCYCFVLEMKLQLFIMYCVL